MRLAIYFHFFFKIAIDEHISFTITVQELDRQVPLMDEIDTKVKSYYFCLRILNI